MYTFCLLRLLSRLTLTHTATHSPLCQLFIIFFVLISKILRVKVDSMLLSKLPTLRTTATIQQNEEEEEKCIFRKFFSLAQRNNALGMEWESFCLFPVVFTIFLTLSLFIFGFFFLFRHSTATILCVFIAFIDGIAQFNLLISLENNAHLINDE